MNTTQDFYTEIFVNAAREKVWDAFVQPDTFFKAFYGADIVSTFQIGERLEFRGTSDGQPIVHIYGDVLEYEAGQLLAYSDHPGPMYRKDHADLESRVRITFESPGQVTKLTVTNDLPIAIGITENNPMQAEAAQWYLILSNLKTYIESGKLMNLEQ
jgi:uncharacterized protein YndB with AHSA1/START domain